MCTVPGENFSTVIYTVSKGRRMMYIVRELQCADVYWALREFHYSDVQVSWGNIYMYTILSALMYTALWVNFIAVMFTVPWGKCIQSSLRWCILRPEGISLHRCLEFLEGTCKCIHCSVRWCILRPEEFQTMIFTVPRGNIQIYTVLSPLMYTDVYCALREFQTVMFTVPQGNIHIYTVLSPMMYTVPWGNFRRWCLQCPEGTYIFILSSGLWCILCPEGISDGDVYSAPREHTDLYCPQPFGVYCVLREFQTVMFTVPRGNIQICTVLRPLMYTVPRGNFIVFTVPRGNIQIYSVLSLLMYTDVYCALREFQTVLFTVPQGNIHIYTVLSPLMYTDEFQAVVFTVPRGNI